MPSGVLPPVLLELRANATEFIASVKDAQANLGRLGLAGDSAAAQLEAATARETAAQERLAAATRISSAEIKATIDGQIAAEQRLAAEMGVAFDEEARRAQLSASAIKAASTEQIAAQKAVASAQRDVALKQDEAAAASAAASKKSGSAVTKYGGMVKAAFAGAAVAVGYESIKMAANFQKQITLLQTAGGESKANLGLVASGIKSLAMSTGTSLSQLTEGMYTAEKAGDHGAAGLEVLKAAAEGAKAEGVDLGTAMNALTSVMFSFHKPASDAVQVENMMVRAAGLAKTNMQEFAGSLSAVMPIAQATHMSFAQVAGAIATLTQHGTTAQEATQNLAHLMKSLQAPSNTATQAMQQVGINVVDLEQHLGQRGLTGTIQLITNAITSKMGPAGLVIQNAFKQSKSATQDLAIEIGNMPPKLAALSKGFMDGSVSYKTYYTSAKAVGGQQYELAKGFIATMGQAKGFNNLLKSGNPAAQTFAGALRRVTGDSTNMNMALMLGGENMGYFKSATQQVAAAGQHAGKDISTWGETSKTLSVQLARVKQMIEVLFVDIGEKLIPIVSAAVGWFLKHKTAAEILAGVIGGVLVVALAAYVVEMAAAAVETLIALWPIELIIVAVGALAYGIYELVTHWRQAWGFIKEIATVVWQDYLKPQWEALKMAWEGIWIAVKAVYDSVILPVFNFVKDNWKIVLGVITGGLSFLFTNWKQVWGGIQSVAVAVWNDGIRPVFHAIEWLAIKPLQVALGVFEGIWRGTFSVVESVISGTWNNVIRPVFGFIVQYGIDPIRSAISGFASFWESIWGGIQTVIVDVYNTIMSIIHGIENAVSSVVNTVKSVGSTVNSAIHAGGDFNPLNWDTGGPVPGAVGQPVAGIVHGGEYVLSNDMINGRQAIDPAIVGAVLASTQRNKLGLDSYNGSNPQTGVSGLSGALPSASAAAAAGGGESSVTLHHTTVVTLDGRVLQESVETHQLRQGLRRGGSNTYQPFKKGR